MNLTLDGDAVKEDPVALGWPDALPTKGVLRFDFVALGADARADRTGAGASVLDAAAFAATLRDVGSRRLTPRERREALEQARRDRVFTCAQAAALLETFDVGASRVEAAAALLPRLQSRSAPVDARVATGDGGVSADVSASETTDVASSLAAEAQALALAPLTAFEQTAAVSYTHLTLPTKA